MFQTQYPIPPPQYYPADYQTPPHTPASARHQYYSPRQYIFTSSPSTTKEHSHTRRATQDYGYSYTTPKKSHYTADYSSPGYYSSTQHSSRKQDYVSDRHQERSRARYNIATEVPCASGDGRRTGRRYSSRYFHDEDYEYLPRYEQYPVHPPPYQGYYERPTNFYARQVPVYGPAEPTSTTKPRERRASYTSKPTYTSYRPRPSTATKQSPRKATEEDARKHQIPAGYSYKNWDPTEEPILLLGSVFDANSLGKWIYDWTVFFYGPASPMSDLAGELWLLLIQLAGKVKNAEDALTSVRQQKNRDMIEDFLDSGERLWQRFNKLLKICENYMWKAAKRECGDAKRVTMGKTSGCEFVDSIFGRDRELERTEKLMTGVRLWALRYTANIDPILSNPAA